MTEMPKIRTAIPQRRYHVGDYAVTLLGEIESGDAVLYQFILAFVEQGQSQPSLYLCCERSQPAEPDAGAFRMRIVNSAMSEVLGSSDHWRHADAFAADALPVGLRTLGIPSEPVHRLL